MKKTVLLFFFFGFTSYSQSVTQAEYFWDNDPGQGNGYAMLALDGNFSQAIEAVVSSNATLTNVGNHTLGVRIKDINGNWSPVFKKVFRIASNAISNNTVKIIQAEYFWDSDPGEGAGFPLIAFDGNFNQAIETVVSSNATLPNVGNHVIGIRVKSDDGNWSSVFRKVFKFSENNNTNLSCKITQAEYFWDNDPGQGNGNTMLVFDGNFNQAVEAIFLNNTTLPTNGNHIIGIRVKDDNQNWSPVFRKVFRVSDTNNTNNLVKITQAEYFWNNDPGEGNGNSMFAFDGNFNQALETIITSNATLPSVGLNRLSIRVKADDGNWGTLFSKVIGLDIAFDTKITLVSPSNGASNVLLTSSFVWNELTGSGTYEYQCSTDNSFNTIIQSGFVNGLTVNFSNLANNTTYYWRVRANMSGNVSLRSDVWSFSTEANLANQDFASDTSLEIHPNPASTYITVKCSKKFDNLDFIIYTIDGKKIHDGKIKSDGKIDVQNLSSGVYVLTLKMKDGSTVMNKFIVE